MNRNLKLLLLGIVLFAFPSLVFSQNGDVEARLSLADGKTVYRMGEPIRLVLSFTANSDAYTLNTRTTKPAGLLDEITLLPNSGVFDWAKQYNRRGIFMEGDDVIMLSKLSAAPTTVNLTLNNFVRFDKPGKYFARVKTRRVSTGDYAQKNWAQVSLTTNEVSFEVKEMSQAEEAQEVERLFALLAIRRDWREEDKISEELMYLAGDASTLEKVKRFLNPQGQSGNYYQNIYLGLFIARNQALIIRLLEDALRDPNREANYSLLNMLAQLRLLQEDNASQITAAELPQQRQKRFAAIQQGYLKELAESLPKRTGKNRTTAAITILQNLPKEQTPPDVLSKVRAILLKEFDNLNAYEQELLLRAYWDNLRDASLVPSIERILTNTNPQDLNTRTTALKRLIELNQERARPFVIAEIRNPTSFVDVEVLRLLDDKFLPEIDDALLEQIRDLAQLKTKNRDYVLLRQKSLLAARYATANIYEQLLETYKTYGDNWLADSKGSLLGYFARHNGNEAVSLIEQALAKLGNGSEFTFLLDLTKMNYPQAVDDYLRKRLNSGDLQTASAAAYLMSKYGTEANKELIQVRLNRWLKEWSGRAAELDAEDAVDNLKLQAMFQVNMIESLILAKAWKLSDEEIKQLKQGCVTQMCRQRFPVQ